MGRSTKKQPILYNLEVTDVAAEGKAIAKFEDRIVFVQHAIPGDVVDVQVQRRKSNFYEGYAINYHVKSPMRLEPFCEHFGVCGGCKWQPIPYEKQVEYKEREVMSNLQRIGKVELPAVMPILKSAKNRYYRNKLEYTFSHKRWLTYEEMDARKLDNSFNDSGVGFHIPGMFDKIIDIKECFLQPEPSNSIRNFIRNYAHANGLTFFDLRNQEGFLRTLMIRTSTTGEVMVVVVFFHEDKVAREKLLEALATEFPMISSLQYVINGKANDTIGDQDIVVYKGIDHINEQMEGLSFKIGPKSFYQTNSEQAYELYKVTRDFADLKGDETVYDLYTGTGTIALFVARMAKKVVGVEYVEDAIKDAKVNAEVNGISNASFYAGDMKDVLNKEFIAKNGFPDVMIVDPPRVGMHADVVQTILECAPPRIVYVSCNSATQARDLNMMDAMYKVVKVQPVDMFPHTHHVENVVLLEKR